LALSHDALNELATGQSHDYCTLLTATKQ